MASKCTCRDERQVEGDAEPRDAGEPLICPRCGGQRVAMSSADALLAKLSQLARFGLAAEDGPLLESSSYEGR